MDNIGSGGLFGNLRQTFSSLFSPRLNLARAGPDDRMGSTLAYLMKLLGERLNADLAELSQRATNLRQSDKNQHPAGEKMTRINLKDMAVLIEKSPRTEAFFAIVADAIKDGIAQDRRSNGLRTESFSRKERMEPSTRECFFVGFILATFRRDYEKRTPTESALSERLYKERYNRAGEFLKYARRSINGYCPWAHVDTAMRLEEAINGPATIKPLKLRKPEDEQTIINALIEELVRPALCALECFKGTVHT